MVSDRRRGRPAEADGTRTDGGAPNATFAVPETLAEDDRVTFQAAASFAPGDAVDRYEWTVETADGEHVRTTTGPRLVHTFDDGGDYRVSLSVTADGATATHAETVTVQQSPRARISVVGDGLAGEQVTLDGSQSVDRDGEIVSYEWEIRDPERDETLATDDGPKTPFTFPEPGRYEIALTVTDDAGLTDRWTWKPWIKKPGNEPPTAEFEFVPERPAAGEEVLFHAGLSDDPDGQMSKYEWRFLTYTDGDAEELKTATGKEVTCTFPEPGEYVADLEVLGDQRERSVMQHLVEVQPADD